MIDVDKIHNFIVHIQALGHGTNSYDIMHTLNMSFLDNLSLMLVDFVQKYEFCMVYYLSASSLVS